MDDEGGESFDFPEFEYGKRFVLVCFGGSALWPIIASLRSQQDTVRKNIPRWLLLHHRTIL